MSSITDGLNHLIDQMVETDRRMARRAGEHIDRTNKILNEEKDMNNKEFERLLEKYDRSV